MTTFETIISILLTILVLLILWIGAILNQYVVQTIELEWRWEEIRKRDEEAERIQRWARKVEWTYPEEDGAFDGDYSRSDEYRWAEGTVWEHFQVEEDEFVSQTPTQTLTPIDREEDLRRQFEGWGIIPQRPRKLPLRSCHSTPCPTSTSTRWTPTSRYLL